MTPPKGTRPSIQYTLKESMKKILKTILPLWLLAIIRRIRSSKVFSEKYRFEMREAKRILRGIHSGNITKVVIVYDNLSSPPTYGDYFFVVMFGRYFISQDIMVSFIIVDEGHRSDWSGLNDDDAKTMVSDYVHMANILLDQRLTTVEVLTSLELKTRVSDDIENKIDIPFRENVIKRQAIYCHMLNTLNRLCFDSSPDQLDRFLLSFGDLAGKVNLKTPEEPYITWNCRYSTKWGFERNTTDEEFLAIYSRLKVLNPDHTVMVVSDAKGCDYFKRIAGQNGLHCFFSKDFSDTLMGDGALILGSDYFFMLRGGGIAVFPIFSRLPHERITYCSNEVEWRHERATSWATDNQIFRLPDREKNLWPTLAAKR